MLQTQRFAVMFALVFSRIQKRTFACGLLVFAIRSKIINCYKFNCILNLHIWNIFIHIYHFANMVTLQTKLLCMMTFARHLTGVAWGKFTLICFTDKIVVHGPCVICPCHFQFRKKMKFYFLFVLFISSSQFFETKITYC